MGDFLHVERRGRVAILRMNKPETMKALFYFMNSLKTYLNT